MALFAPHRMKYLASAMPARRSVVRLAAALVLGSAGSAAASEREPERLTGIVIGKAGVQLALVKFSDGRGGSFRPGQAIPGIGVLVGGDAGAIRVRRPDGRVQEIALESGDLSVGGATVAAAELPASPPDSPNGVSQARLRESYGDIYRALSTLADNGSDQSDFAWSMHAILDLPTSTRIVDIGSASAGKSGQDLPALKRLLDQGHPLRAMLDGADGSSMVYVLPHADRNE